MTLRVKLQSQVEIPLNLKEVQKLEIIADEFAIGFSDWMYFKRKHNSFKLELMTKDYLEIYKKENNL